MFATLSEPRVIPFKEGAAAENNQRVGARYKSDGSLGPVAEISVSKNGRDDDHVSWITISADDYEGSAMLHIEALPLLIEALEELRENLHKSA